MAWNTAIPTSSSAIVDIPTIFQENQIEMENILGVEHYTYTSSLSGRHRPGITGHMEVDTTLVINAISNPGTGAIALDTTLGAMKTYDGSTWNQVSLLAHPTLDAYQGANVTIPSGSTETLVPFNTENNDPLSAHSTTTGKFIAPAAGYYLSVVHLDVVPPLPTYAFSGTLYRYNSSDTKQNQQTNYILRTMATNQHPLTIVALWYMAANDYLIVKCVHNYSGNFVVGSGADNTWWKIYRMC